MRLKCRIPYLAPLELWIETKPYKLEGHLPEGLLRSNVVSKEYDVDIADMRDHIEYLSIDTTGFEFRHQPTSHNLWSEQGIDQYIKDMENVLKERFSADRVHCFSYTKRRNATKIPPLDLDPSIRPHASVCHIDQTAAAAEGYVKRNMGVDSEALLKARYRIINIWRPLFGPVEDCPLALCDSRTSERPDLLECDYIYPHFETENFLVLSQSGS